MQRHLCRVSVVRDAIDEATPVPRSVVRDAIDEATPVSHFGRQREEGIPWKINRTKAITKGLVT